MGGVVVRSVRGCQITAVSPTLHQQVHQMIAELVLLIYSHPKTLAAKDASLTAVLKVFVLEFLRTFPLELFMKQLHPIL